ncbi:putative methyltransferase [Pirellula staleyi DSM 6068]|uniref:tRNA (guanine(46)-N(7))-methyltransferase n=1 Tax=Pirellula staleyi (strain ATCC 27377 / DSM 6068 / ICPB 4128) TaxID=530564 RepID=D2R3G1_PIRSD|nr:methyltransferase domain-containing protein [Pirellula staleyi]ADB15192.1 putative methyltransferase [Pirellula staleyi DSM 6068]
MRKQEPTDTSGDNDYGVPIPGNVLPETSWAKTAIKRLPPEGPLDFAAIFGRIAPVVLDLGCGNGRFTITSALKRPEIDHIATDILPMVIRYATRRANQRGLFNTRWVVSGAYELLDLYIAPQSVQEIHLYHPQPYHDTKESYKRLITPEFMTMVYRSLRPDGLLVIQTDNKPYWQYVQKVLPGIFDWKEQKSAWPDAPQGRTRREIYARNHGLPIYRGYGSPLAGFDAPALEKWASSQPLPRFATSGR